MEMGRSSKLVFAPTSSTRSCKVCTPPPTARYTTHSEESLLILLSIRFFALSVIKKPDFLPINSGLQHAYVSKLTELERVAPQRLLESIEFVKGQTKVLFERAWPMVYGNLGVSAQNCFFDCATGNLVGCSNWSRLDICPFGVSEAAIDLLLGYRSDGHSVSKDGKPSVLGRWTVLDNYAQLKRLFFAELKGHLKSELNWEPDDRLHVALALGQLLHVHHTLLSLKRDGRLAQLSENDEVWMYLDVLMRGLTLTESESRGRFWDDSIDFSPEE